MSVRGWLREMTHPLRGLSPEDQYSAIQWGRRVDRTFTVTVPHVPAGEELVMLGWLRALWFADGRIMKFYRPYPYLTIGSNDHKIYFVGGSTGEMARRHEWGAPGSRTPTVRIDYDSRKGRRRGKTYFYHHHDAGPSTLIVRRDGWPRYEGPYTVRPDGIVG